MAPRDGSGGYSPPQNSWNPAINGMGALPNDWMAILNDMAATLQASIAADGQTPITGSLNFGNNRLRNVGAPQGQGDGLRLEQIMKGADIPSAETIAFPIEGSFFEITGTTAIKTITPAFMGRTALVRFTDVLTLTNSTNLQLPGGANITTQAGDFAVFLCTDSIKWVCWLYPRVQIDTQIQPAYTDHYGPTAPATTWPGMTWADKATGKLKRRNDANTAWIIESDLFQKSLTQYNAVAAGSVNARTATLSPPITAYVDQDLYLIRIPAANTTATPTLNLGGGAKTVVKSDNLPLVSGDMVGDCVFQWNATLGKFVLINPMALGFAEQPSIAASATFTKTTNNIALTGIQTSLALEVGDVIQVSGSTSNDNLYTVETITNANNLIVNYEHRNGAGSLSLTNETKSVTIKRIAKWFNAAPGLGKARVNLTTKRTVNTLYTSAPFPMALYAMIGTASGSGLEIDGVYLGDRNAGSGFEILLNPGSKYKSLVGGATVWLELR